MARPPGSEEPGDQAVPEGPAEEIDPPVTSEVPAVSAGDETEPSAAASAVATEEAPPEDQKPKRRSRFGFFKELPVLIVVAFLLALLIKSFLVQAFYIPSGSMEPTLQIGDRVLVNKVVYHLHDPRRGDVIVFQNPHPIATPHRNVIQAFFHWVVQGLGVSTPPDEDFIKRVIGLPGETLEMRHGVVYIDGRRLDEPYLNAIKDTRDFGPEKIPAGQLFVMGDNRTDSNDSRFGLGTIPLDKVVGRAFVIIWPPSRVGWLRR